MWLQAIWEHLFFFEISSDFCIKAKLPAPYRSLLVALLKEIIFSSAVGIFSVAFKMESIAAELTCRSFWETQAKAIINAKTESEVFKFVC